MYEIEVKLKLNGYIDIEDRLRNIGAEFIRVVRQEDYYFQHPCRDFKERDEALRLRIEDYSIRLGYKGPKLSRTMKIREELEVGLDDGEVLKKILDRLGFKLVAVIRKIRRIYKYGEFLISLDEVDGLGKFIEIEGETSSETLIKDMEEDIGLLVRKLGLKLEESVLKSYLELYLEKTKG
jgi:adenylate cyclase class 2